MNSVELRPAFAWTCDECGRDNYVNLIVPELSPKEVAKMEMGKRQSVHIDSPKKVKCPHCKTEFSTNA